MRNGYKITLGILTIMILITITIGTSYSFYSVSDSQETPNNLATTCFELSFDDEETPPINLLNSYPMSEESAIGSTGLNGKVVPYKFTITNKCGTTNTANYIVTLNTLSGKSDLASSINYVLTENRVATVNEPYKLVTSKPYDLPNYVDKGSDSIDATYKIAEGTLMPGEENKKTFYLYLWIKEDANLDIAGQQFEGKILVYAYL